MHFIPFLVQYFLLLIVYCCFFVTANAQYLHGPSDIQQIMQQSDLFYQLDSSFNSQVIIDFPVIEQIGIQDTSFRTDSSLQKYHSAAIKAKKKKNYKKALTFYQQILDESPAEASTLMEMAATYQLVKQWKNAILIYQQIIVKKKFAYAVHQQLANCHVQLNQGKKARRHILLAHLYNRNNTEIASNMQTILKLQGVTYLPWQFVPKYQILLSEDNKNVLVGYEDDFWKSYACCKAVWQFEPKHAKTMQYISDINSIDIIEEKECLFNLIAAAEKSSADKDAILTALSKAILSNHLDNFILYEIHLCKKPELAFSLTDEVLEDLMDYVLDIRVSSN